jgi:hypothetical protein
LGGRQLSTAITLFLGAIGLASADSSNHPPVRRDGIHFQRLRYLDLSLAAYTGEDVVIRYDPRDMAEIRVYHLNTFICQAVCQELADQTISLQEIIRARNRRRCDLNGTEWTEQTILKTARLFDIAMPSANEAWAVGESGAVLEWTNGIWDWWDDDYWPPLNPIFTPRCLR